MVRTFGVLAVVAAVSACGVDRTDRALSGAGLGAAAGGLGAAVLDRDVGAGIVAGGLIGAAAGGLTDADDIDLGDPIWRRGDPYRP